MKKFLALIIMVLFLLSNPAGTWAAGGKPTVVKDYNANQDYVYQGYIVNTMYLPLKSGPGNNYSTIRNVRHNGWFVVGQKLSNGWYKVSNGLGHDQKWGYVDGKYLIVNRDDVPLVVPDTTFTFKPPVNKAPLPGNKVPEITTKATEDTDRNFKIIADTLGFSVGEYGSLYFDPQEPGTPNWQFASLRLTKVTDDNAEAYLVIEGWGTETDGGKPYYNSEVKMNQAIVREILKFYFPTQYDNLYTIIDNGFKEIGDYEQYLSNLYELDGRQVRLDLGTGRHGGQIPIVKIGKPGVVYNHYFEDIAANKELIKTIIKNFKDLAEQNKNNPTQRKFYEQKLTGFIKELENNPISLYLDNKMIVTDAPPVIKNDRNLVPLRAVSEAFGAKVNWDKAGNKTSITRGNKTISLVIGSKTATVNGQKVAMDIPSQVINGRTYVPLRFIAEVFNFKVDWDSITRDVKLTSQEI